MFPEYREELSYLRQHHAHFDKIFSEHNELDHKIKNAEEGISPLSNQEIEVLKKHKLRLKDEIYNMILEYKKGK